MYFLSRIKKFLDFGKKIAQKKQKSLYFWLGLWYNELA